MYSWLESEVLAMSDGDYMIMQLIIVVTMLWLTYICFTTFRKFRIVDATATSKIRSAAQGYVELKGLAEWMKGDSLVSPFSNSRCVWYHCTIEKREKKGKRNRWTNISDERSTHIFRLIDDTGCCIIDPDHAHVIAETDNTWFGRDNNDRTQTPEKKTFWRFNSGNYRFRERLIRPATALYALGEFSSCRKNMNERFISNQVEDVIRRWKQQPQRYLGAYDIDENGKIQGREWSPVRAAARKQVLERLSEQDLEHHLLSKPKNTRLPYILSAIPEADYVRYRKINAYTSAAGIILIFSILVVLSSIRSPFSI